jgi:hypothetical protein
MNHQEGVDIPGSVMVAVLRDGRMLHDSISLRAFVALLGAGDELDEITSFYERQLGHTGGIEIDTPRAVYGVFVKGRTCACCGHVN